MHLRAGHLRSHRVVGGLLIGSSVLLVLGMMLLFPEVYSLWSTDKDSFASVASSRLVDLDISSEKLTVEIAITMSEKMRGLSGRASLPLGSGMLFVYDTPGDYGFWMKDMRFPIDIIWISEDRNVVGFSENLHPDSYPELFYPPSPAQYVLEVPAGFTALSGIREGDPVSF